jgi:hypothetical protein
MHVQVFGFAALAANNSDAKKQRSASVIAGGDCQLLTLTKVSGSV